MSLNIGDTIAPTSEQMDAVDLLAGPRTFTIERVSKGSAEQPFNIHLAGFPRPWRPGKSMRRVLVACWGPDAAQYVGRRVRLWCDPKVRYGGAEVGGVRILALSHLDATKTVPLLVTRGRSAPYTVEPLRDEPPLRSEEQSHTLAALMREVGLTARDEALALFAGWIGRTVGGTKELTAAEAATVIRELDAMRPPPSVDADGVVHDDTPAGDPYDGPLIPQGDES